AGRLPAVLGPTGAAKTRLINPATGALLPDSGELTFKGETITRLPVHRRIRMGLSRSFQIMNIFARLPVLQNVLVPVLARRGRTGILLQAIERESEAVGEAREILRETGLLEPQDMPPRALAHGRPRPPHLGAAIPTAPEP